MTTSKNTNKYFIFCENRNQYFIGIDNGMTKWTRDKKVLTPFESLEDCKFFIFHLKGMIADSKHLQAVTSEHAPYK